jgi:hypothetical protein
MANEFKVIRTVFENLENLLNSLETQYEGYYIYQILPEHSYDGALAVVILCKVVFDDE